jgi:hypothetical protein
MKIEIHLPTTDPDAVTEAAAPITAAPHLREDEAKAAPVRTCTRCGNQFTTNSTTAVYLNTCNDCLKFTP